MYEQFSIDFKFEIFVSRKKSKYEMFLPFVRWLGHFLKAVCAMEPHIVVVVMIIPGPRKNEEVGHDKEENHPYDAMLDHSSAYLRLLIHRLTTF